MASPTEGARSRRRLRLSARSLVALGIALLVVGVALTRPSSPVGTARTVDSGARASASPPSEVNLTVNLTDTPRFLPDNLTAGAGMVVHLTLRNVGVFQHTFTLSNQTGVVLNTSWSPEQLDAYFHANASQQNVSVAPGATQSITFTVPAADGGDSFEYVSVAPYQFQAGMWGFFNITGAPSAPGEMLSVSTSASALAFIPAILSASPPKYPAVVDIAVSNLGSNAHTFWLESQPNNTLNPGNFTTYFGQHPPLASVNVPTSPGVVIWANFSVKSAGVYQFICTIPGHFAAGMTGYLYIGVPAPAVAAPPSTAIVSVWVLWGGAAILAIGTLLAATALLVGRFPRPPPTAEH
jgi:uncharacterized cupredoxin-like copper-binding protein